MERATRLLGQVYGGERVITAHIWFVGACVAFVLTSITREPTMALQGILCAILFLAFKVGEHQEKKEEE